MIEEICIFNVVEYMVKNNIMTTNTSRATLNFWLRIMYSVIQMS